MKHHHALLALGAFLLVVFIVSDHQRDATAAEAPASSTASTCNSLTGVSSFAGRDLPEIANSGKVSTFGGPDDTGVSASEGLALGNLPSELFLPSNDPRIAGQNLGQARRLDPDKFYIAARWPYTNAFRSSALPADQLGSKSSYDGGFPVLVEANGKKVVAWAVDYGPHGNTTDKDLDLSPGLARALGVRSGDTGASISYVTDPNIRPGTCSGASPAPAKTTPPPAQTPLQNLTNTNQAIQNARPFSPLWMSIPFCFKHTGPATRGFVAKAPTCNSGINYTPSPAGPIPIPVPDCGPGGALCAVPLGCLNLVCKAQGNAIWDPFTGACGCG